MAQKNKYDIRIESNHIESTQFYKVKRVYTNDRGELIRYLYEFNMKFIRQNGLTRHLDFNIEIFTKCSEISPGQNLHTILNTKQTEKDTKIVFIYPYQCRLNQYVRRNQITQEDSVKIMRDVIEAIYSVYKDNYICCNFRAENFVSAFCKAKDKTGKVQNKTLFWKLQSLPFVQDPEINQKNIDSPYTFKKQYDPPQKLQGKSKDQQIEKSLVWSLGCLWLEILYGKNILQNEEQARKLFSKNELLNFQALNLPKKLIRGENLKLISNMLQYDPSKRIPLKKVFQHQLFCNNIDKYILNQFAQRSENEPSSDFSIFDTPITKYDTLLEFICNLIKIIEKENLFVLSQQKAAIRQQLRNLNQFNRKQLEVSNYSPKNLKKSRQINQLLQQKTNVNSLTTEQLQRFLKPYKFYYDKTIFLCNCSSIIIKKLKQKLNQDFSFINQIEGKSSHIYDLLFSFCLAMLCMRTIYLRNLLLNLELNQNVFSIPNCLQNIQNSDYNGKAVEWQIFNQTAIYEALKIFFSKKFLQCQTQLQFLIEAQNASSVHLSEKCGQKVNNLFKSIDYKKCSIQKFYPHFQNILAQVIYEIDENCILKKGFKMESSKNGPRQRKAIENIGLLQLSIYLESPTIFQSQFRHNLFSKFMKVQSNKELSFLNIPSKEIKSRDEQTSVQFSFIPEKDVRQIFSFRNYQNFLRNGQYPKVLAHVNNLLRIYEV